MEINQIYKENKSFQKSRNLSQIERIRRKYAPKSRPKPEPKPPTSADNPAKRTAKRSFKSHCNTDISAFELKEELGEEAG